MSKGTRRERQAGALIGSVFIALVLGPMLALASLADDEDRHKGLEVIGLASIIVYVSITGFVVTYPFGDAIRAIQTHPAYPVVADAVVAILSNPAVYAVGIVGGLVVIGIVIARHDRDETTEEQADE